MKVSEFALLVVKQRNEAIKERDEARQIAENLRNLVKDRPFSFPWENGTENKTNKVENRDKDNENVSIYTVQLDIEVEDDLLFKELVKKLDYNVNRGEGFYIDFYDMTVLKRVIKNNE